MKNNYPIKYAVIPINEYNNKYGNEIVCYIVSKVYLVSEELNYNIYKKDEKIYNIVSPYDYADFNTYKRVEPQKDFNGRFTNIIKVDKLFDNLEDALKEKEYLNNRLLFNKKVYHSMNNKQRDLLDEAFNNTTDYYNELERLIESNTPDLVVDSPRNMSCSIIKKDNVYKETDVSIYETIKSLKDFNYKAFSVTKKDYNKLLDSLSNNKSTKRFDKNLLIINDGKNQVARIMKQDDYFYINNGIIYRYKYDLIPFDDENYDIVYYTTETYDDILSSYPNEDNKSFKLKRKL